MNAREWKLIIATVLLSVAGSMVFWHLNTPVSQPILKSPEKKASAFDFYVPRIEKLAVRNEKVESIGEAGGAVKKEELAIAPPFPAIIEPPTSVREALPITLLEKPGTLPSPIAVPIRPPTPPRQPDPPPRASLTYIGFAVDDAGAITAFVEGSNGVTPPGRYNAREGDFLFGRFQVTRITPVTIELEDMEGTDAGRKQTFPIKR